MSTVAAAANDGFFEKIWNEIKSEFGIVESVSKQIADWADSVVNTIKGLESNQTVQFLQSGLIAAAEAIDPALTPLISGIELALPKIATLITNTDAVVDSSDADQLNTLVAYLQKLEQANPSIYAATLATLSTAVQQYVNKANGIVVSDSQVIASVPVVHAQAA